MFMGEYNHSIDAKSRLIIPTKLREDLQGEFILTRGLDGCLCAYPENEWREIESKLRTLPMSNAKARQFIRFLVSGATTCELDKQGRILIPSTLREFAQIDKEVVLTGAINRVEIWSKEKWVENNTYDDMDALAAQMADMGLDI